MVAKYRLTTESDKLWDAEYLLPPAQRIFVLNLRKKLCAAMIDLQNELIETESQIKEMSKREAHLLLTLRKRELNSEEQLELRYIQKVQPLREDNRGLLIDFVRKINPPDDSCKCFEEADHHWTESVTGISSAYRNWISYKPEIDESIFPTPTFKENYMDVVNFVDLDSHASRRVLINVYLRDIMLRPEFGNCLRVFPGIEVSVASEDGKRRLRGKTDLAIGWHVLDQNPRLRLIVVEAKFNDLEWKDMCYCTAQAAALYKSYKDSESSNCCVWGVISKASHWKFIFIDHSGKLWRSKDFIIDLCRFDENLILMVYRRLYYVMKCCADACSEINSL